jgi:hypothetical protein
MRHTISFMPYPLNLIKELKISVEQGMVVTTLKTLNILFSVVTTQGPCHI